MTPRRPEMPPAEAGFALIEVLVSAAVIVVVSAGTFGLLQAMTRAAGDQRLRSQAFALAQEDQARLRSMRLTALQGLKESRPLTLAGTTFTVHSRGSFINNKAGTLSCADGSESADYAQVKSWASWPGMDSDERTVLKSLVSPSSNSIDSEHGTLTVSVANEKGEPKAGVDLKVGGFSDTSSAAGCATFPDLPQGTQNLESLGEKAGLVNRNSNYAETTQAGIGAGATKLLKLTYDKPGAVPVKFKYWDATSKAFKPAFADSLVAFHSVMKGAKVLGTPGGTRLPELKATPLFPFTSPYSIYAGSCAGNQPDEGSAAMVSAVVPAGDTTGPVEIQLPALDLTVEKGGAVVKGATVTISDRKCNDSKGNAIKRVYTTNKDGKPSATSAGEAEPGLPWSSYDLCASATFGSSSYRKKLSEVAVQDLAAAKTITLDLTETGKTACS